MIIVVEGPDGAGKTSLCRHLAERTGFPVYKPVGDPLTTGMSTLESQAHDRGAIDALVAARAPDLIMDRSFPSEWVYSLVFERQIDTNLIWALDRALSGVDHLGLLVSFRSPSGGARQARRRGMTELSTDEWKRAWWRYEEYIGMSSMTWTRVDAAAPEGEAAAALARIIEERMRS